MDAQELKLRKDVLLAQIRLGLHLSGVNFGKKPTARMSLDDLRERVEWLRGYYKNKVLPLA